MRNPALAAAILLLACDPEPLGVASRRAAIIDAPPAPEQSAVVQLSHRDRIDACSGAVIAPSLVVTAKHCVFRQADGGDQPLPADGFRIALGPDEERFELRYGAALSWVGMPDETDVDAAVEAGQDVAIVTLSEPVPEDTSLLSVRRSYQPREGDELTLVGFGISDIATGVAGVRRAGQAEMTGLDPESGVLQLSGAAACFGDSGGPVLFGDDGELVAIVGQIAGDGDGGYCESGLSFASSIVNPRVRALLFGACRDAGGCGPRAAVEEDPDVGPPSEPGGAPITVEAGVADAAVRGVRDAAADAAEEDDDDDETERDGCVCTAVGAAPAGRGRGLRAVAFGLLVVLAWRLRVLRSVPLVPRRRHRQLDEGDRSKRQQDVRCGTAGQQTAAVFPRRDQRAVGE